jgi:uncharacterized RDD family membrane protein YckC
MASLLNVDSQEAPHVTLASRRVRLFAFLLDTAIYLIGSQQMLTAILAAIASTTFITAIATIWWLTLAVVQIGLLGFRGQTIGKLLTKIAIVNNVTKDHPGYLHAAVIRQAPLVLLMTFVPPVGFFYFVVDCLLVFSQRRRCIHDYLAGTEVVNVESGADVMPADQPVVT